MLEMSRSFDFWSDREQMKTHGRAYETALISVDTKGNIVTSKALLDASSEFFPNSPTYGDALSVLSV